jgi:hypothetical protein
MFGRELDFGQPVWKILIHLPCAIVIQPFAAILEGLSAIWAMSSEDLCVFLLAISNHVPEPFAAGNLRLSPVRIAISLFAMPS